MGFDIFNLLQEGFVLTINLCFGIMHILKPWETLSNIFFVIKRNSNILTFLPALQFFIDNLSFIVESSTL